VLSLEQTLFKKVFNLIDDCPYNSLSESVSLDFSESDIFKHAPTNSSLSFGIFYSPNYKLINEVKRYTAQ
jgi:hypothetical protein